MQLLSQPAFETLYRKLRRSYGQAGMLPTLQRCFSTPWKRLAYCIRDLSPRERRFRAEETNFDGRHNVDTRTRRDSSWMARVTSPNWVHGIGYAPVPAADMSKILAALNIDHKQFVFIDLGAGKGRAVLVAAQFPFKRILGIEYSPGLVDVMKNNIGAYRNPGQRCFAIEGRLQDATEYDLPPDPLVLFFHHPFEEVIFRQVRSRIEQSLAEHPREILIIYYDPLCATVFDESPHFKLIKRGVSESGSAWAGDWIVYEACAASTARSQ
jgi:SAM-dependent methyltransferase